MHSHKSYYIVASSRRSANMFPYPDLRPPLPVTSAANGQLLSGHSIPLHSIKFQTVSLISRKIHDILLKCTRKSASRSASGQLPLERRMRIQRGKEKRNHFAWISNRLVTCGRHPTKPTRWDIFFFFAALSHRDVAIIAECGSHLQNLFVSSCGPRGVGQFFFASSRGLLISFFGTFWAVPGSFSGPSGTFCSWTSRSTRCPWRFRRGFVGGRWQGQRKPPRLAEQKWIGETEKLGNELSQIAIDNERYSTVYGLLPKSFKF